jgi:hypothetical protein
LSQTFTSAGSSGKSPEINPISRPRSSIRGRDLLVRHAIGTFERVARGNLLDGSDRGMPQTYGVFSSGTTVRSNTAQGPNRLRCVRPHDM